MAKINLNSDPNPLPWPDGTAKPFALEVSDLATAFIPVHSRDWEQYAHGYDTAIKWIFEHWQVAALKSDPVVLPLLFLCRHYLEIRLKQLIQASHKLLSMPDDWPQSHNLALLWSKLRPLLERVWPDGPIETLQFTEKIILAFHRYDPTSMTFRYPIDRKGARHLAEVESLSLPNLHKAIMQVSTFLESCECGITAYIDSL